VTLLLTITNPLVSLFQRLLHSTLPLKTWKMTCPQTILYSHCFPASQCPEAWFPQHPKPTADSLTPTEDAIAHLRVPLANPAASNQVFDFYRPCTRPQNLEFLTFTVPALVAEFIPFPSCFPSAYYTAPTASVFASEVLQLPVCPSQSLPPPSASISVLPCHPHIHSSNRFHESLHRCTSSLLTLFRGFTASFANNMGLGYSVGG